MHAISTNFENTRPALLIGLGGLSVEVLERLAERGTMPNLAANLSSFARAELQERFFYSPSASWATLNTGLEASSHGVFDEFVLDHSRRRLTRTPPCSAASSDEICRISDAGNSSPLMIFRGMPGDERELDRGLDRATGILAKRFAETHAECASGKRHCITLKLMVFDSLFLRLGNLLGIGDGPGGRRSWIAKSEQLFRTLDEQLETLLESAARNGFTIAIASPYRFVPFRGKIVLNELLRRKSLLRMAEGRTQFRYECSRFFEKQKKRLRLCDRTEHLLGGLLPIDWRRTRAVSLHGENAAFIYLVTPERFGAGPVATLSQREETTAEALAAIADARDPFTDEPLFQEAFSTAERFGFDPVAKRWPEIIGIPAAGYQVRQRFDHARQLVRPDPSVAAARTGGGFLCWPRPAAAANELGHLDLSKVMGVFRD
jgi:predicted AlkP superfamily phosphohydrolase/phosphomutase